MKRLLLTIALLFTFMLPPAMAEFDLGIKASSHLDGDGGKSLTVFASHSLFGTGVSLGAYASRSYDGADDGNSFYGVDYILVFNKSISLGLGPMYAADAVRNTGEGPWNWHAGVMYSLNRHLSLHFDYFTDCRSTCNQDSIQEPRTMLGAGLRF